MFLGKELIENERKRMKEKKNENWALSIREDLPNSSTMLNRHADEPHRTPDSTPTPSHLLTKTTCNTISWFLLEVTF
jgi:hypothetical protein